MLTEAQRHTLSMHYQHDCDWDIYLGHYLTYDSRRDKPTMYDLYVHIDAKEGEGDSV